MKYLFSVLLLCLALAGHTQDVIKFRDLPDGVDMQEFVRRCLDRKLALVPGNAWMTRKPPP